ncbi:uncharacterized protein FFB20_01603 [Fusarium fujikuroi]|nr:uncharacterized protein FFB20_01603 [Fusarium fujikuroi]SCO05719.1 uncharacterized protein FFM5_08671 [Fusarium fujikuroi]SCO58144.1 uncharacterized protein FFMR_15300 [Fusarium fujikuroi]
MVESGYQIVVSLRHWTQFRQNANAELSSSQDCSCAVINRQDELSARHNPTAIDSHDSFIKHIRPKLVENTGSRPLSHSQAAKRWISSWVGDDQRIPGVVVLKLYYPEYYEPYVIRVRSECPK